MARLVECTVRLAGPDGRTRPTQFLADTTVRAAAGARRAPCPRAHRRSSPRRKRARMRGAGVTATGNPRGVYGRAASAGRRSRGAAARAVCGRPGCRRRAARPGLQGGNPGQGAPAPPAGQTAVTSLRTRPRGAPRAGGSAGPPDVPTNRVCALVAGRGNRRLRDWRGRHRVPRGSNAARNKEGRRIRRRWAAGRHVCRHGRAGRPRAARARQSATRGEPGEQMLCAVVRLPVRPSAGGS